MLIVPVPFLRGFLSESSRTPISVNGTGLRSDYMSRASLPDPGATRPPSGEQVAISFGDQRAVVVTVGGGLREYSAAGLDALDGYGVDAICDGGRGQLLVPWPNRLRDGRYTWGGRELQLSLSEPE